MEVKGRLKLAEVNEYIVCHLCKGYLIDATTIVECMHTFCRSCLISYIEEGNKPCPRCGTIIHHSYPLQYIGNDRTLQEVVEKLVPCLKQKEHERKLKFYRDEKLPLPDELSQSIKLEGTRSIHAVDMGKASNYHRLDEQVDVCLRNVSSSMKDLRRPFLQLSVNATIKILKKYLAKHLGIGIHRHTEVDILCNNEILGKDHTLRFILVTRWRSKKPPLHLEYRPRIALL